MRPGELIAGRFEIDRLAGGGGMGSVWRALDREAGMPVALKVMARADRAWAERFAQEARVLADLAHPGIVRYVAHGSTRDGQPFLAMEWLEGLDLGAVLARGPLPVGDALALARGLAAALGLAHGRGVVHRDVKPANVFLLGGDVARPKLVDFGIAKLAGELGMTQTGVAIGTPAYMAPEQARGDRALDARADVFALGCVIFECLTGASPFAGAHPLAVIAKILLEPAPTLSTYVAGMPPGLDRLLKRMLAKSPADRPADGEAVLSELREIESEPSSDEGAPGIHALTGDESRMLFVVLVGGPDDGDAAVARTLAESEAAEVFARARAIAAPFGASADRLVDGSIVLTLTTSGAVTDQVSRAAHVALAARSAGIGSPVVLATGRSETTGVLRHVGAALERAVEMLTARRKLTSRGIAIDETTLGLLESRFRIGHGDLGPELLGELEMEEPMRTLLGRPTRFVGRDRELRWLTGLFEECVEERAARCALVVGGPGMGKSRLRHELLANLAERASAPVSLIGQGAPAHGTSPFGMIVPALRRTCGILAADVIDAQREKIRRRVARNVPAHAASRVADFLAELMGAPSEDDTESLPLAAARREPRLMTDQIQTAWQDFLVAECSAGPVVLVMEDLQWGDLPSVHLVDAALRTLAGLPFLVVALGRPEVDTAFPDLWSRRELARISLARIPRRASEQIVRDALGEDVDPATVERLVEQCEGNAFFLEELVRAVAGGATGELPGTVMAILEARLERLDPSPRRTLRAASVFGHTFHAPGVLALLGEADHALPELVDRELVVRRSAGSPDPEYAFRHALVRDAAYAMLTDGDRALGHALAGAFLERAGGAEPIAIAEHYERGQAMADAVRWYLRAARQASERSDAAALMARATRGIACGAGGEDLAELLLRQGEAHTWLGDTPALDLAARQARAGLPAGSDLWCLATSLVGVAARRTADLSTLEALARDMLARLGPGTATRAARASAVRVAECLSLTGRSDLVLLLVDRVVATSQAQPEDPALAGLVAMVRAATALHDGSPDVTAAEYERAAQAFERAGDLRNVCTATGNLGYALVELGAYADGERVLRSGLELASRTRLDHVVVSFGENLGLALVRVGKLDEARATLEKTVAWFVDNGNLRAALGSRNYLALALLESGDLDGAEREARAAAGSGEFVPAMQAFSLALLARTLLVRGDVAGALDAATSAHRLQARLGRLDEAETFVRLAHAECLSAAGDAAAAAEAFAEARAELLTRANRIADPAWRARFLEQVPEHARLMDLSTTR